MTCRVWQDADHWYFIILLKHPLFIQIILYIAKLYRKARDLPKEGKRPTPYQQLSTHGCLISLSRVKTLIPHALSQENPDPKNPPQSKEDATIAAPPQPINQEPFRKSCSVHAATHHSHELANVMPIRNLGFKPVCPFAPSSPNLAKPTPPISLPLYIYLPSPLLLIEVGSQR